MFFVLKTFSETFEIVQKLYGDSCIASSKLLKWFKRFKNGHEGWNYGEGHERPKSAKSLLTIGENVTARMLAEVLNLSTGTILIIITDDLSKRSFVLFHIN